MAFTAREFILLKRYKCTANSIRWLIILVNLLRIIWQLAWIRVITGNPTSLGWWIWPCNLCSVLCLSCCKIWAPRWPCTGRPPSVSGGRCWLKSEQRSFVIYRRNTYEQYGGYNLFQNAEFKAIFQWKFEENVNWVMCHVFFAVSAVLSAILRDEYLTSAVWKSREIALKTSLNAC